MTKIIGYHAAFKDGRGFIANSYGETSGVGVIDWLLNDHQDDKKVTYDIDYFAAVLFRLAGLSEANGRELAETGKTSIGKLRTTYYKKAFLAIGNAKFSDAGQYLNLIQDTGLDNSLDVAGAVAKANEAREVAVKVSRILFNAGLDGSNINSPVSSLRSSLLRNLDLPNYTHIPHEVTAIAAECQSRRWIEIFAQGKVIGYDYDLTSAYAAMLMDLYDTRRGDWTKAAARPDGAVYGFERGTCNITARVTPIIMKQAEGLSYTPQGSRETVLTMQEVDFIKDYKQGEFTLDYGWYWTPRGKTLYKQHQFQPLKGPVNWLFNKRVTTTDELAKQILKRALAGLWGMTGQTLSNGERGEYYNMVWNVLVETNTRLAVARALFDSGVTPLSVAVDGCITDKPLNVEISRSLGGWKISHQGEAILIRSGLVAMQGKQGTGDYAVTYDAFNKMVEENPDATEYTIKSLSPVSLSQAVQMDYSRLGELVELPKTISIGDETKRNYFERPVTGRDILIKQYESFPLDVTTVRMINPSSPTPLDW
jgi:hypothetical protein